MLPQRTRKQKKRRARPRPRKLVRKSLKAQIQRREAQPATITIEKKQRDKKKLAKRIGITTVSVVGALAAIYLAGVFVFSGRFYPNTHISNIDISWETPLEVQHEFEDKVGNYSFDVKGHGLNFSVTSEEAGLNIDSVAMTDTIKEGQDPWKWPIEIFEHRDMSAALTDALSATKLFDVVNAEVEQLNTTAKDPVNAYVTYNDKASAFVIEPEVQGTKLSAKAVLEDIVIGAMNLDPEVVIMEDDLLPPAVLHDDERLLGALDQANALIKADLDLMLSGTLAAEINAATIYPWVSVTPEFAAVLNTDAMNAYANELASNFNTIGKTRTYVRPDGKQVTVSGGDYGWAVNQEQLAASIAESIANGVVGAIDIPVKQTGKGFSGIGGKDWGARYIDVDISQQHARFYGDDGSIIWESNIITGKPSTPTPTGVYDINLKGRHVTLTGRDSAGNITYESPVSYWMPFKGNSVGFHDADWQSSFGGNRYRSGHGSHGCVNLPVSKAKELYSIIQTGDVVVVHG